NRRRLRCAHDQSPVPTGTVDGAGVRRTACGSQSRPPQCRPRRCLHRSPPRYALTADALLIRSILDDEVMAVRDAIGVSAHNGLMEKTRPMTTHKTGTRQEWLAARIELLAAEKDLTRRCDAMAQRRREVPWVRIDTEYRFDTDEGNASLKDLFRGRSQLLVYHFMFGPDYTAGCATCSTIADGFNGFAIHLAHHDVMLMAVSRAPPANLQA